MARAFCNAYNFSYLHTKQIYYCLLRCWCLRLRPHQDLVPVPGHCALAPKGMLFTHCGAQKHFLAVCIYDSNCFVDRLTAATSNRRETWITKNMALMESCADKCPCPSGRCPNTTFGESARTQVLCSSFCTGTTKMLHSHWCPCPSAEPGHQVWMRP